MLTQLVASVRIPVSASTLLICWPREAAQVSVCLPCKIEVCWERSGMGPKLHCPEEMAEVSVPLRSLDLIDGKSAQLHHAVLSPMGANCDRAL